jgi:hypothetical protein
MPVFAIRDTIPCHVTFLYQVQAESEDEAHDLFMESPSEYLGHEVGETIGFLDTTCLEIEPGDSVKAETRTQKAAPELLQALEELLADLNDLAREFEICQEIIHSSYGKAARAAIAKAKGIAA